jgi:DNA polymerase kappa
VKDQSPRKKTKLSYDDPSEFDAVDEMNEQQGMEEAMPGFHEDDETDLGMENDEVDEIEQDVLISRPVSAVNRLPTSVSNGQASSSKQPPPTGPREIHEMDMQRPPLKRETATHDCPVCGKTLETDNEGLNTHVDFCLSRGAIMEAQVEASQSSTKGGKYKGWPKPESKKKFEIKPPVSKGKPPGKRGK